MTVTVRFFAGLREQAGTGQVDVGVEAGASTAVRDIWARACGLRLDEHNLVAINQCYAGWDARVHEGDEVAFFPPVTGG